MTLIHISISTWMSVSTATAASTWMSPYTKQSEVGRNGRAAALGSRSPKIPTVSQLAVPQSASSTTARQSHSNTTPLYISITIFNTKYTG